MHLQLFAGKPFVQVHFRTKLLCTSLCALLVVLLPCIFHDFICCVVGGTKSIQRGRRQRISRANQTDICIEYRHQSLYQEESQTIAQVPAAALGAEQALLDLSKGGVRRIWASENISSH